MSDADSARVSVELTEVLEEIALKFRGMLSSEMISISGNLEEANASIEDRLKAYTGYFKILRDVELMIKGIRQQRDQQSGTELEVLEFRRQLEEQIARLVDKEAPSFVSGGVG